MPDQQLDYIFIAVKQYHITDILPFVRGKSSLIFLQNGMSHLHTMQKIENENVAVGIVEHGAKRRKTYRLSYRDRCNEVWNRARSVYTF